MSHELQLNKLWLKGFSFEKPEETIKDFLLQFGQFIHFFRPPNRDYVFLTYISDEEALAAKQKCYEYGIRCNYARKRETTLNSSSTTGGTSSNTSNPVVSNGRAHFPDTSSAIPVTPVPPVYRNGDEIIMTHVRNSTLFYAYPASRDEEYKAILQSIAKLAKQMKPLNEVPRKKMMLLAPYKSTYYRALIMNDVKDMDDLVTVSLVDTGLLHQLPARQLKSMPNEYANIRIAYSFQLDGIEDDSTQHGSYAAKCLETYIGRRLFLEFDGETAKPRSKVRLIDPYTDTNINEIIKSMMQSFPVDDLIRTPAPIGQNQMLITIDESKLRDGFNIITFIDRKHSIKFHQTRGKIQNAGEIVGKYPVFRPKEAELCLVKFDGMWHRGIFVEDLKDTELAVVLLVDIGKAVEMDPKDVRNITDELVKLPVFSFIATINGFRQTINKAKVDSLITKFKANDVICIESICEGPDKGIYLIDI